MNWQSAEIRVSNRKQGFNFTLWFIGLMRWDEDIANALWLLCVEDDRFTADLVGILLEFLEGSRALVFENDFWFFVDNFHFLLTVLCYPHLGV